MLESFNCSNGMFGFVIICVAMCFNMEYDNYKRCNASVASTLTEPLWIVWKVYSY